MLIGIHGYPPEEAKEWHENLGIAFPLASDQSLVVMKAYEVYNKDVILHPTTIVINEAVAKRFLGSPTIRINGMDVDPSAEHRADFGMQCRVYLAGGKYAGMPSKDMIRSALLRFTESRKAGQRALADSGAPTANTPQLERLISPICC